MRKVDNILLLSIVTALLVLSYQYRSSPSLLLYTTFIFALGLLVSYQLHELGHIIILKRFHIRYRYRLLSVEPKDPIVTKEMLVVNSAGTLGILPSMFGFLLAPVVPTWLWLLLFVIFALYSLYEIVFESLQR
jgi:4-hydroxybenzoate polyprenyltransferase